MKKLFTLFAGLCLFALSSAAQTLGPISVTNSSCATIGTFNQGATVAINVSGSWSGTLLTQGTVQGQAPFTVLVTPAASTISQSGITANGGYVGAVAGLSTFQLCGSAITGTAVVFLNGSLGFDSLAAAGGSIANSGLVVTAAGTTAPSPLAASACPTGEAPFIYGLNGSSQYQDLASWNTSGSPPTPAGQINWCWPMIYNDTGTSIHPNRAFSVVHYAGNGGLTDNGSGDDSAIMGILDNLGTQQDFHQLLTFYGENVLTGNPTFHGHAGGESSVAVYRGNFTDNRSSTSGGGNSMFVFAGQLEKQTTGQVPTGYGVFNGMFSNEAAGDQGGRTISVYSGQCADTNGTDTNFACAVFLASPPTNRFPGGTPGLANMGLEIGAFGTAAQDFNIWSAGTTTSGFNAFNGPSSFGTSAHAAAGLMVDVNGGVNQIQTYTGTATLDNVKFALSETPSATVTGATNILNLTNTSAMTQAQSGRMRGLFVNLSPSGAGALTRIEAINASATGTNTATALNIAGYFDAEMLSTSGTTNNNRALMVQSGQAASGGTTTQDDSVSIQAPSTNGTMTHHAAVHIAQNQSVNTGSNNPDGWAILEDGTADKNKFGLYFTNSACAANGTAANPSLVSCSGAPAGKFSCATNASAATCQVNTTAVTAASQIHLTPTAVAGTLGVTCNTAPSAVPAVWISAISAATSFTINMPTITTNPACFDYYITN